MDNIFYLDVTKGEKIFIENGKCFYRFHATDAILCVHTGIRIDSSHDRLAHTLAHLPDSRNSTSDLISPKLAGYDFFETNFFWVTAKPSSGREGDGVWMTVRPSSGRERVKIMLYLEYDNRKKRGWGGGAPT